MTGRVFSVIVFSFLLNLPLLAQKKTESEMFYDRGNVAFANKDYRIADSLFSLSIKLSPHPDNYYNRAVCRKQLNDAKGYCLDLNSASYLGDEESRRLYTKQCVKYDTIYKKYNGETAAKEDYEIVEYLKIYNYNTDFDYEKSNSSHKLILSKVRRNNEVIYKHSSEVETAKCKLDVDSLIDFIKLKTDFFNIVQANDMAGYISVSVVINEKGYPENPIITDGEYDKVTPVIFKVLFDSLNWIPAKYNNRVVKYMLDIHITYYEKDLFISSHAFNKNNKEEIFKPVEVMPEFPGGVVEMMKYIQKNLKYPRKALEANISGKCFLKFVVLPNGNISNVVVLKGINGCTECSAEAVRMVKSMPKWKPATQDGKPVPVFFNLPINFVIR